MASSFAAKLVDALEHSWAAIARPNQLPPLATGGRSGCCSPAEASEKLAPWQSGYVSKSYLGWPVELRWSRPPLPMRAMSW